MPGYMLHNKQTGHPVMGAIGPRRTAVLFVSHSLVTGLPCAKHTLLAKQAYFPQGGNLRPPYIRLVICVSYENGYSPRCNLTHNRVTRLMWWHTLTRHEKGNKFPSHTWLPYLTPNGVTHLTMLLIDIKILQNRAGKNHGF